MPFNLVKIFDAIIKEFDKRTSISRFEFDGAMARHMGISNPQTILRNLHLFEQLGYGEGTSLYNVKLFKTQAAETERIVAAMDEEDAAKQPEPKAEDGQKTKAAKEKSIKE